MVIPMLLITLITVTMIRWMMMTMITKMTMMMQDDSVLNDDHSDYDDNWWQ